VRFKLVAMAVHLRTDSNIYAPLCQDVYMARVGIMQGD